jgi:hypothetical protein
MYVVQKNSQTKEADVNVEVVEKPDISRSPQITDPAADWQTYQNKEFGFKIRYPADWLFNKENASSYGPADFFEIIYAPMYKDSIPIRKSWIDVTIIPASNATGRPTFLKCMQILIVEGTKFCKFKEYFEDHIIITAEAERHGIFFTFRLVAEIKNYSYEEQIFNSIISSIRFTR